MRDDVTRGGALGIVGQAWHLFAAFFLYAFLARRLGPSLFGEWSLALSVLAWFEVFVIAGLVKVATRSISEAPAETGRLARAAFAGQIIVSLAVFAAAQLAAGAVARLLGDPALAPLIRVAALDIPAYGLFMAASSVTLGMRRYGRQGAAWIVYATAKALLIAGLVAAGFSVRGALVGNALSSLVGFAAVLIPAAGRREDLAGSWSLARSMAIASVPFLALSLVEGVGRNTDLWLLSAVAAHGVGIGLYAAAMVLAEVPVFLFLGLNRVVLPAVAGARADGDGPSADRYTALAVRVALIVTVLATAFAVSIGRQALELVFSASYADAYVPLALLMVAAVGRSVQAICTEVLMAEHRARSALTVLGVTVAMQVALVLVLVPRSGAAGAAAGSAVSALAAAAWAAALLRSALGMRPLATLARCALAATGVGGALALLNPVPLALLLAVPVASVLYAGALVLLREFDARDVAALRLALGRPA